MVNRKTQKHFNVKGKDFKDTIVEMEPPSEDENPIIFDDFLSIEDWIDKYFNQIEKF